MAINVVVEQRRGESSERLIRRFIKKCKRDRVIEIYRSRTDHFIRPAVRKKMKQQKARRDKQKLERTKNDTTNTKLFR